jgi:enamine deaminase RidA (YjgF/YER057c/UK114 family)
MPITRINPDSLHETAGYAHITLVTDATMIHLAGQCPLRLDGTTVLDGDGPLEIALAQTDQVIANTMTALAEAGATPSDVIRTTIYVVSPDSHVLAEVWERFTSSALGPAFSTASTLVGASALGYAGQLVELDVTAALPL